MPLPRRRLRPANHFPILSLFGIFLMAVSAAAQQKWLHISSANFELFTTAGEKRGRGAIVRFEQIQSFFVQSTGMKPPSLSKVRIVAFNSEKEYKPYRPNQVAAAFFQAGATRDYIVMRDLSSDSSIAAAHEYFHLWMKGSQVPLWLNEGLADYYSTLRPRGTQVLVGEFPPGRYEVLLDKKWADLNILVAADHNSPYYNEQDRASIFYSQSWALAHMLNLRPSYREEFKRFYRALAQGTETATAFQELYGKSLEDVQKDLKVYVEGGRFQGELFDLKLEKAGETPGVEVAPKLQVDLALAEMLTSSKDGQARAKQVYEELARQNPGSWEAREALAYLALRQRQEEEARKYFGLALELGTKNAKVYFDYAMLLRELREDESSVVSLLNKAVELQPSYSEAHYYIGLILMNGRNYQEAIKHLTQVKQLAPYQSSAYYNALALAYYQLGKLEQARGTAQQARKDAQGPAEVAAAERLLEIVNRDPNEEPEAGPSVSFPVEDRDEVQEGPPRLVRREQEPLRADQEPPASEPSPSLEIVEGSLVQVDCLGDAARLQILVGGKKVLLAITDPTEIVVTGSGSGTVDFRCGPQKPRLVSVGYERDEDTNLNTSGVVKSIEFK